MGHRVLTRLRSGLCLLLCLAVLSPARAESVPSPADRDLLFLEVQHRLREEPSSALSPSRRFAAGEYLFEAGNFTQARDSFLKADEDEAAGFHGVLAKVYLTKIALLEKDPDAVGALERLKKALSDKRFLSVFGEKRQERWVSPLKNHYTLIESVDKLEVYLNDALFYEIQLP